MQNYLTGYLDVLPEYQRRQIENILEENRNLYGITEVTEEAFRRLIEELARTHKPTSHMVPQVDRMDPEAYNTYKMNTHIDLNTLFMEILMIESAVSNFESIFDGIISDLEREVGRLKDRVDDLKAVSEGEHGLIVHGESFESSGSMADESRNPNLYMDRDGSIGKPASFERRHDQYFIGLPKDRKVDAIRPNGVPTATVRITERRGAPIHIDDAPERYHLDNAIDGNPDTYWAEVVLVDEPIKSRMGKGN